MRSIFSRCAFVDRGTHQKFNECKCGILFNWIPVQNNFHSVYFRAVLKMQTPPLDFFLLSTEFTVSVRCHCRVQIFLASYAQSIEGSKTYGFTLLQFSYASTKCCSCTSFFFHDVIAQSVQCLLSVRLGVEHQCGHSIFTRQIPSQKLLYRLHELRKNFHRLYFR